jgi:hypothetical protein
MYYYYLSRLPNLIRPEDLLEGKLNHVYDDRNNSNNSDAMQHTSNIEFISIGSFSKINQAEREAKILLLRQFVSMKINEYLRNGVPLVVRCIDFISVYNR